MRRFKIPLGVSLFAAIWLLVLIVPPLRESFPARRATQNPYFSFPREEKKTTTRVSDDPRLAAHAILSDFVSSDEKSRKQLLLQLDALARRFPRENWIRADCLRASTQRRIEMETEMSVSSASNGVSPSTSRWLGADFRLALALAVEGAKREPDNAFFPWMEAVFHFGLRQNDAALAALSRAGKCPRWNDYTGDEVQRRLAVYGLEKDLLWEEKVMVWSAQLLPHFGSIKQASDAAIWQGILAMRRGDHARALQIFEAVMSASRPMQRSDGTFIGVLVGESLERDVWERVAKETGTPLPMLPQERSSAATRPQYRLKLARVFALYARKHGRNDLATQAVFDAKQQGSAPLSEVISDDFASTFGVSAPEGRIATQGPWLGTVLGFCALWCASVWAATAVALRGGNVPAPRASVARCANFTFWASVIFVGLLLWQGAGGEFAALWGALNSDDETQSTYRVLQKGWPWALVFGWLLPLAHATFRRPRETSAPRHEAQNRKSRIPLARAALWGAAAFLIVVISLDSAGFQGTFDQTLLQWPNAALALGVFLVGAVGLEIVLTRRGEDARGVFVALMAAIGSGGTAAFFAFPEHATAMAAIAVIGFAAAFTLWARAKNASEAISPAWENAMFFARLARGGAGALAVVCSILYLVVALSIWPPRAKINAAFEHRLQIGEVAAMRQQLASQRKTAPR